MRVQEPKMTATIMRAYKSRVYPTTAQAAFLARCCGLKRFAYNWALARRADAYKTTGETIKLSALQKEFRARRATEWPWALELSDRVSEMAIRCLDVAYRNFFRRVKSGAEKPGFPKFKARQRGYGSCQFIILARHISARTIQLPKLGKLRLAQEGYLPTDLAPQYITATVSERAGRWFATVQVEVPRPESNHGDGLIAVHLGVKHLAVALRPGGEPERFENPKALTRSLRKLARLQRKVARKTKGSMNRRKAVAQLQRAHERIVNVRQDAAHRMTTAMIRSAETVGLEDWAVQDMMGSAVAQVARHMADASFGELARQLVYKADWMGANIVRLAKGFPATKRCARCGEINEAMDLSKARFWCPACGHRANREINAVENVLMETTGKPPGCNAPGGGPLPPMNGESDVCVDVPVVCARQEVR